jgi:hypothetical protein
MKSEMTIGRDPNADVLINDAEISRHHAVIKMIPEGYTIEDLGSTNGTIINGQRILGPHLLRPGEMINLGEHIALIFEAAEVFDPDATIASARMTFAPPPPPRGQPIPPPSKEPIPSYQVPTVTRSAPEPAAQVPEAPVMMDEAEGQAKTKLPKWLIFTLIGIIAVACICLIAVLIYIDSNYLWCKVFPFLPGCLMDTTPTPTPMVIPTPTSLLPLLFGLG